MNSFEKIQHHVLDEMLPGLSAKLTYHNIHHTMDVVRQVQRIAEAEGIVNKEELYLLKVAALYHDCGFLFIYDGHEEISCDLARQDLPSFGVDQPQIDRICELIMATKVPQRPNNLLEQIICDADLDYLGQDEFQTISDGLRQEFLEFGIIESNEEWYARQLKFLEKHQYFTDSSRQFRNPVKCKHLDKLKAA